MIQNRLFVLGVVFQEADLGALQSLELHRYRFRVDLGNSNCHHDRVFGAGLLVHADLLELEFVLVLADGRIFDALGRQALKQLLLDHVWVVGREEDGVLVEHGHVVIEVFLRLEQLIVAVLLWVGVRQEELAE